VKSIKNIVKISGAILPLLLLVAGLQAPAAFAGSSTCPTCGESGANPAENISVTVENLKYFEEVRAIFSALACEDTRMLMREVVIKDHYTPNIWWADAYTITATKGDVIVGSTTVVEIPFRTFGDQVDARVIYSDDGSAERAFATITGPATILEEPMEILKENETYQAIVENLEDHGYEVNEESALVIKSYRVGASGEVAHSAFITVEAIKGDQTKEIVALVCLDEDRVIAVADGYWSCMGTCLLGYALDIGGTCYIICLPCAVAPSPATCAPCAGCVGAFVTLCAIQCALESLWPW